MKLKATGLWKVSGGLTADLGRIETFSHGWNHAPPHALQSPWRAQLKNCDRLRAKREHCQER